ncbi:MAG: formate--phosphoribosylaminoimidazolecarboxamide ligase [Thermoplasmata archaeon]|nr:formate--phosphoribosylaminoimidazolecarboxamide ligase [Thermoplasmata archaeon]
MVSKKTIRDLLKSYGKNLTVATVCSHSSLQIFYGAKKEGLKTLGIAVGKRPKFYDAFPLARPDEFFVVNDYQEILSKADELAKKNVIVIPHGSFVEYLGPKSFMELGIPAFGNREVLDWESDREKERLWLTSAGVDMPRKVESPKKIDKPVLVKYDGAKGGKGSFIAKDYHDFKLSIDYSKPHTIQEYVVGTRYYVHYFYSPITDKGYKLSKGSLEILSIDRRDESNIDEMYKLGSQEELKKKGILPTFVVTGNIPLVIRESLLPKLFDMGEKIVEESLKRFGGIIGPFCLETIVTDQLEFKVFEISARIVAGTNFFISGSPYSDLIAPGMSTGTRIAMEIKNALALGRLDEVIS